MQGTFVYHTVTHHAVSFLIVGGKMFDAASCAGALDAFHHGSPHLSGQHGIFTVIFKISSTQGASLDIQPRPQQQRDPFSLAFVSHYTSQLLCQSCIKACGHRSRRGEAHSRRTSIYAQVITFFFLFS